MNNHKPFVFHLAGRCTNGWHSITPMIPLGVKVSRGDPLQLSPLHSLISFSLDAEFLEFFHLNDSIQTVAAPLLTPFPLDFLQKKDLCHS